ncbi:hypothetical protein [Roseococcus sp.]|uniref:hypothetical protein n=1 Tax=Roseococcus sp. TaxID=2109646 RepID=UPI003BAB89EB
MRIPLALVMALAFAGPTFAQQRPSQPPSGQGTVDGCGPSTQAAPVDPAPQTTGWAAQRGNASTSGPTSGIPAPAGVSPQSPEWHAPIARGLDPIGAPIRPPRGDC